jgi:hypothetical protein
MVDYVLEICKDMKLETIYAIILRDNYRAIDLMKKMGFKIEYQTDDTARATLDLKAEERQCDETSKQEETLLQIPQQTERQIMQEQEHGDIATS